MKCHKCGYTSFDYNQRCPKCNKDLSQEREWINLTPFKPNPPSLLGNRSQDVRTSDLDMALLKAKDAQVLERELGMDEGISGPELDFELPGFLPQEKTQPVNEKKNLNTISDSEEAELKLVLDT
ncbi:MAG: hypothetical protein C4582_09605 [Desulfobacteraceae bacterium]|jgi:hypothetical protein|nr:MAG: hypothetical protein C4582_09605 [Desulfobacteraceae bacterium]